MIDPDGIIYALSVLAVERAMGLMPSEYPCAYMLVVHEACAGTAMRISAIIPKITPTISKRFKSCTEWKLVQLTPDMEINEYYSPGQ